MSRSLTFVCARLLPLMTIVLAVTIGAGLTPALCDATVEDLVRDLRSSSAPARAAAAQRLGEMGAKAVPAVPALVALLGIHLKLAMATSWARRLGRRLAASGDLPLTPC